MYLPVHEYGTSMFVFVFATAAEIVCLLTCLLQNYEHLFKINDKKAGGSFYLQSKVWL